MPCYGIVLDGAPVICHLTMRIYHHLACGGGGHGRCMCINVVKNAGYAFNVCSARCWVLIKEEINCELNYVYKPNMLNFDNLLLNGPLELGLFIFLV